MTVRKLKSSVGRVHCLGTGDGWPCADRNHSSYLYELAGAKVLIDCGESVSRALAARGFDWNSLQTIFLSHTHADHLGGLFMLLQGFWLEGRNRDLQICLPAHAIRPLQQMLRHGYLFEELFGFKLRWVPLKTGREVRIGRLRVTPFLTTHLDSFQRAFHRKYQIGFDAYSFLMEGDGRRVAHSADLGAPGDLLPLLGRPVDLMVCELAHFQPDELFAGLRGHSIRRAAFIHLSRNLRERLATVKRLAKEKLPGISCVFPKDGETVEV